MKKQPKVKLDNVKLKIHIAFNCIWHRIAQNLGFQSTEGTGKNLPFKYFRRDPNLLRFSVLPHRIIAGEE